MSSVLPLQVTVAEVPEPSSLSSSVTLLDALQAFSVRMAGVSRQYSSVVTRRYAMHCGRMKHPGCLRFSGMRVRNVLTRTVKNPAQAHTVRELRPCSGPKRSAMLRVRTLGMNDVAGNFHIHAGQC